MLPGDPPGHHGHGKRDTAGRSNSRILRALHSAVSACGQAVEHRSRLDEERRRRKDDERKLKRRYVAKASCACFALSVGRKLRPEGGEPP